MAFISDNFLLQSEAAKTLYHDFAKAMPIIDYHNHLSPQQINQNHTFENITELWLNGDHYKWRAMRANGVDESYCTGNKSDEEKFLKWAETVPFTVRNPLFHWSHLELSRYFGIEDLLTSANAKQVYEQCNAALKSPEMSVQHLLQKMKVEVVCTTDDPTDSLEHHVEFGKKTNQAYTGKLLPTFRPDKFIMISAESFLPQIEKLKNIVGFEIPDFETLLIALNNRINFFHESGGRLSDHGLETIYAADFTIEQADKIFKKAISREVLTAHEALLFQSAILHELAKIYHKLGWTQQFHLGALRNNNPRAFRNLGPDTGWDSIGDWSHAQNISRFMGKLDNTDQLAKTILYNNNPTDNAVLAAMIGNFNDGSIAGKVQFGSGWWFMDQKRGMEEQINMLSDIGLISRFVGMLTDSRSFLSFTRHEYFRRILCNLFGEDIKNGELPNDIEWSGKIIQDICYNNANKYFGF
ncbi:MAG: glucuronate isomerase [Spirosomaceae bacterium]|nr:glucuronate isomerase [Spirosomataceae bacterium]